ncbi:hypothetical protein D3OALGB2SA_4407 [Olavius algarvensis associated proteobacterium Delta 3]|nr:hypothetical protein D3OALGB2SA_4407 [Olavius algarvensis associated proteobacterium Delta 3]
MIILLSVKIFIYRVNKRFPSSFDLFLSNRAAFILDVGQIL